MASRNTTAPDSAAQGGDPLLANSWREAKIILALWFISSLYSASYCYLQGYLSHPPDSDAVGPPVSGLFGPLESFDRDPETLTFPLGLGIPDWVFYGVVLPWLVCIAATFWFCLFVFNEDDLGVSPEDGDEFSSDT